MNSLDLQTLSEAVAGGAVAIRSRLRLHPAGGPGDKVMPATYGVEDRAPHKYADEDRIVGGERRKTVLLSSVAAGANQLELALREAWESGDLALPILAVDFSNADGLEDLDRITVLDAPHRAADAILRDSLLDGTLFRLSDVGLAVTNSRPGSAAGLFHYSPTSLLFGMWDSTGPKGGLGAKFERAITSEIVGLDAEIGVRVGSRIDPLAIEKKSAVLYEHVDPAQGWTLDEAEAAKDEKGKPKLYERSGGEGEKGTPSKANHGNIAPTIDRRAGGVTISEAVEITVLSLAALRKLRFPVDHTGAPLPAEARRDAETAARTALAALGLAAMVLRHEFDYDLRSRCLLVPVEPRRFELLRRDGSEPEQISIDRNGVIELVRQASEASARAGLPWATRDLTLTPAPKLVELVRLSRDRLARLES